MGSAGERCPNCGAYPEDYGPVFYGREQRWSTLANRRSDGALVRVRGRVSFSTIDGLEAGTMRLVETWKARREPWNYQWVGPPLRDR